MVGLLGALPFLAMMVAEFPGVRLVEARSRRMVASLTSMLPRFLWVLIAVLPFLVKNPVMAIAIIYFVLRIIEYLGDPAWTSIVGDLVKEKSRGRFFGKRFHAMTFWNTIAIVLAGLYLNYVHQNYTVLFIVGAIVGIASGWLKGKVKEPEQRDHTHHTIKEFIHVKGEFLHFCLANVVFRFGVMLAAPLITVYILKNLNLSVGFYALLMATITIAKFVVYPLVGKLSDKVGDKSLAVAGMAGASFVPIFYFFIQPGMEIWLFAISAFAGVVWAFVDISHLNLLMGLTTPESRPLMVAEFNTLSSIPNALGPIVGGLLADKASFIMTGIPSVFILSGVLRAASLLPLLHVSEPRVKTQVHMHDVFQEVQAWHPTREITHELKVVFKNVKRNR
jgi:MFS family permease